MYYIDFDNTLYETGKLTKDVLNSFSNIISTQKQINFQEIYAYIKDSFNSTTDNFISFAKSLSIKYNISFNQLYNPLMEIIITNGSQYTFPDAINFLKKLKKTGHKSCILTFVFPKNLSQQALKLTGSGLLEFVDEVYTVTSSKSKLHLDFENSTFIEDSPKEIEDFYNSGARNIIRIIKPNNEKRTSKKLNIPVEIPTFTTFDDIITPELSLNDEKTIE